jgi:hypothetical protein
MPSGKYFCRIYRNGAMGGHVIGKLKDGTNVYCIPRERSAYNFEGCPYNVLAPHKPIKVFRK